MSIYGIPQDELTMQAHEALRTDGWLDPDGVKNIAEQLSAAQLVSAKYKESADHYVNKCGELEQEILRLNSWANGFTDSHLKERQTGDALVKECLQRAEAANARAEAVEANDRRYRQVKQLTKEQLFFWRGAYGCSDEAIDAMVKS